MMTFECFTKEVVQTKISKFRLLGSGTFSPNNVILYKWPVVTNLLQFAEKFENFDQ